MHASANEGKDRIRAKNHYALKNLTSDGNRMVSIKLPLGFHEVCHQSPSVSPLYFALFVGFFKCVAANVLVDKVMHAIKFPY